MYKYPYGDSQQLNLDWILAKLKELEAAGLGLDLEEVSNALISLTYNTSTAYRRYDYAFRNGKLYRCLTDTTGAFDPAAWQEALIGDDLAVLTRWINAIDAAAVVDVKFDTSGTNGKIQQKYHDQYHDVVEVDYTPVQNSKRPLSSNAGYELTTTKRISTLSDLDTSINHFVQFNANINVGGITFPEFSKGVIVTNGGTDATLYAIDVLTGSLFTADRLSGTWRHGRNITSEISNLNGAISDEATARANADNQIEGNLATIETGSTASRRYEIGEYVIVNGYFCRVKQTILAGGSFSTSTNITIVKVGEELTDLNYFKAYYSSTIITSTDGTPNSGSGIRLAYNKIDVKFTARILLQNMTQNVRPVITLTHNDFKDCPSFECYGNPVLRGSSGVYTDECYASHVIGTNIITISQNNFLSPSLPAGWGVYQIPGISLN